jgi:hypothetical protein
MPPPTRVVTATTFAGLHKRRHFMDTCILVGRGIEVGDPITVTGSHGATMTLWVGFVMAHAGGTTFTSSDLHVVREEAGGPVRPVGTENVAVTVTNQADSTDVSTPLPVASAPIIP